MTKNNNMDTLIFMNEQFYLDDIPTPFRFEKMVTHDNRSFVILQSWDETLGEFINTTLIFPININEKLT